MATVFVSADQIEKHLNEGNVTIKSFEWVEHYHQPNFEFTVDGDLSYDDLDLIDVGIFNETEEQLDKLTIDHTELQKQFDELSTANDDLQKQFDELTIKYNKLVASKNRSWKFWK
jgi:hypothetical protein